VFKNYQPKYLKQEVYKMKQKRFKKRLNLNKQTIAQLDQLAPQRMDKVQAGADDIITEPLCGITIYTVLSYLTNCDACPTFVVPQCVTITTFTVLSEITECVLCNNEGDV
jgi:hypothetical protein